MTIEISTDGSIMHKGTLMTNMYMYLVLRVPSTLNCKRLNEFYRILFFIMYTTKAFTVRFNRDFCFIFIGKTVWNVEV